ncbi:hypothetical protein KM043_008473 [Ampulex compressa]|nr:hypothetical protein KM043_008473 [Ampulex compressa]
MDGVAMARESGYFWKIERVFLQPHTEFWCVYYAEITLGPCIVEELHRRPSWRFSVYIYDSQTEATSIKPDPSRDTRDSTERSSYTFPKARIWRYTADVLRTLGTSANPRERLDASAPRAVYLSRRRIGREKLTRERRNFGPALFAATLGPFENRSFGRQPLTGPPGACYSTERSYSLKIDTNISRNTIELRCKIKKTCAPRKKHLYLVFMENSLKFRSTQPEASRAQPLIVADKVSQTALQIFCGPSQDSAWTPAKVL